VLFVSKIEIEANATNRGSAAQKINDSEMNISICAIAQNLRHTHSQSDKRTAELSKLSEMTSCILALRDAYLRLLING